MLAAEDNHEGDSDNHAHNDDHHNQLFPPAQLADAELAIVLRNFPLRLVAQSFLQFMEILRNLWKGSVGRDAVWTKSSLDVIAHFSCSVCPNIFAISFQKSSIFRQCLSTLHLPWPASLFLSIFKGCRFRWDRAREDL